MIILRTFYRLQSTINKLWRIDHGDSNNESESDTNDEGVVVDTIEEKDKRKCFKYGKAGYVARECRSRGGNGDRGFNGRYNNCSK